MTAAAAPLTTPNATAKPRELRWYQSEAVNAVQEQWSAGTRRTSVVLPTGTGKSTVIAKLAAVCYDMGLPVAMIAHRDLLINQLLDALREVAPHIPTYAVGRVQGADTRNPQAPIIAATIQTLAQATRRMQVGQRQVFLFDETHHVTATSWLKTLEAMGVYNDDVFFCGFTATMRRSEGKALRTIIESIAYEKDLRWAFKNKFLIKPHGLTVKLPHLDLNKVKTTAGDFNEDALAEVMEAHSDDVVKAILTHARDRRPIIFAPSVAAAKLWAEMLSEQGFPTECVVGETPRQQRQQIFDRFEAGRTRGVTTVAVLTEGADFPWSDCIVLGRPTLSQNLYVQMTGRCERLYDGKTDALVLDLVGTSRVMKLVTLSSLDAGCETRTVNEDGEELEDAPEEIAAPVDAPMPKQRRGISEMIAIDLLGDRSTDVRWLATADNIPFFRVPASTRQKDVTVFLWPLLDGTYQPGWVYTNTAGGTWLDSRSWPLAAARDFACDFVTERGIDLPSRSDKWYRSAQGPSISQLEYAARLGIVVNEGHTKGDLSDLIDIAQVTKRLRPNGK